MDSERHIEDRIVKYIEGLGGRCVKLKLVTELGWPDRTCLLPGGLVLFVEVKRSNDSHRRYMQEVWQDRLKRLGFAFEFVSSVEEVAELVRRLQQTSEDEASA